MLVFVNRLRIWRIPKRQREHKRQTHHLRGGNELVEILPEDYLSYTGPGHPLVHDETRTKPYVYNLSRPLTEVELRTLAGERSRSLKQAVAAFQAKNGRPPHMCEMTENWVCIEEDFLGLGSGLIFFNGYVEVPVEALLHMPSVVLVSGKSQSPAQGARHVAPPIVQAEGLKNALLRNFKRPTLALNLTPIQELMVLLATGINHARVVEGGAWGDVPELGVYYD